MTATQHTTPVYTTTNNPVYTTTNNPWLTDGTYTVPLTGTGTAIGTGTLTLNPINMNKIQQTKVAVFNVTRNENQEIINAEFIKEMWIQTKAGTSVEFEAGRDKDLTKYDSSELVIKQITSTIF